MRILSQDGIGTIDLPYEQMGLSVHSKTEIIAYPTTPLSSDEYWIMARYSTEDKAKKAIEMLHEEYRFEKQFETISCGTTDYPSKPLYYFKLPSDDELED